MTNISPLAEKFPDIANIAGVELHTAHSGMRYKNRDDVFVAHFPNKANVAGVFTKNTMTGHPVVWCKKILPHGKASVCVVNAGYSNVFTGAKGDDIIEKSLAASAKKFNCPENEIYLSSTGIIGQAFDPKFLTDAIETKLKPADFMAACKAINTTDTFSKGAVAIAKIGGKEVKIAGIIKGSGMIAPNMATMLGYVFTDAKISANALQTLLSQVNIKTYNSITVDSDTSTSDTILAFATGAVGNDEIVDITSTEAKDFAEKFFEVNKKLAELVVKDGEGATKFITIEVTGAKDDNSAQTIALAIANSPLVKTAIAGEDANWGRIIAAVGKSGQPADINKTSIYIGDLCPAQNGQLNPSYDEKAASEYMKNAEIYIKADVAVGGGKSIVYTCDLTHGYISINADYRS